MTQEERWLLKLSRDRYLTSGIVLILSQVPFIEVKDKPRKALYVKRVHEQRNK